MSLSLQWRHNGRDSVSNHQPHDCLLNRSFRRGSKKTSKLRIIGLCAGNSPGTGEFPAQMASYAENAYIWWRHHDNERNWTRCHSFYDIMISQPTRCDLRIQCKLSYLSYSISVYQKTVVPWQGAAPLLVKSCVRLPGIHFTQGLCAHNGNLIKILVAQILVCKNPIRSLFYTHHKARHMRKSERKLSCGVCNIVIKSDNHVSCMNIFSQDLVCKLINPLWNGPRVTWPLFKIMIS